ncbi:hypothetical protein K1719_007116 [Acacia pycnantha]|nr:hypothetical protein K1719_007116 [Acacia pycnantha]
MEPVVCEDDDRHRRVPKIVWKTERKPVVVNEDGIQILVEEFFGHDQQEAQGNRSVVADIGSNPISNEIFGIRVNGFLPGLQSDIGHNVVIGKNCMICGQVGIAGSATIGDYVTIGGRVAVRDHTRVDSHELSSVTELISVVEKLTLHESGSCIGGGVKMV